MHHIIVSSAACLALQNFSTLPHKWHIFFFGGGEEVNEHKNVCFDFLYSFHHKHFSFQEELGETS